MTDADLDRALATARAALGTPEQVARVRTRVAEGIAAGAPAGLLPRALSPKLFTLIGLLAAGGALLWLRAGAAEPRAVEPARVAPHVQVAAAPQMQTLAAAVEPQPAPRVAPLAAQPVRVRAAAGRRVPPVQPRAAEPVAQPTELELISRAEALVDRTPSDALDLLATHERLYPHGMLGEERDVLCVDAEWALGRRAEALGHARSFLQRYPSSAQTRRLARLLADHNSAAPATPTE